MKYKGQELTEITTPNIDNLPKKMLVWYEGFNKAIELVVCATAIDNCGGLFFIARDSDEQRGGISYWKHCAEIPEEPKPHRATNRELAKWLAQGNGELNCGGDYIYPNIAHYAQCEEDYPVSVHSKIRKWSDTEWHEPTIDYMGIKG